MKKIEILTLSLALGGMFFLAGCVSVQWRQAVEVEPPVQIVEVEPPVQIVDVEPPVQIIEVEVIEELVMTHTVVRGESLWSIAALEHVYGDTKMWRLIFEANRDILDHPDALMPGQVLVIPRK